MVVPYGQLCMARKETPVTAIQGSQGIAVERDIGHIPTTSSCKTNDAICNQCEYDITNTGASMHHSKTVMRSVRRMYWILLLVSLLLVLNIIATVGGLTVPFYAHI